MKRIDRPEYLQRIISRKDNGLIKVITGIRRCGKSYLLFDIYYDYLIESGVPKDNIITVSLDDVEYLEYCDPIKLNEYIKSKLLSDTKQYYIFIDEAQYAISKEEMKNPDIPIRLYAVLNGLLRKKNVDVYITGSNSKFLSTDIMTEFRGRGDEIHIGPLSFCEYYPASGKDKEEAWKDYICYGGLPYILSEENDIKKGDYLEKLYREIYIKDVCERYGIKEENGLEELMKLISSSIGSLTNPQKISDTFNSAGNKVISMPTIKNYLRFLEEAFIIKKVDRFDLKGRKYISTPVKYYYSDLGIRNAMLNFRQVEETHLMENAIYNELFFRGFKVDVGVVPVNMVDTLHMDTREKTIQESNSLNRIGDNFKKIIVVKDNIKPWRTEDGILVLGLWDFLLKENSMDL